MTSSNYGLKRQHNYVSQKSSLNNSITLLDSKSIDKLMNYNQNMLTSKNYEPLNNSLKFHGHSTSNENTSNTTLLNSKINSNNVSTDNFALSNYMSFPEKNALLSAENDSQQNSNPLKFALNSK